MLTTSQKIKNMTSEDCDGVWSCSSYSDPDIEMLLYMTGNDDIQLFLIFTCRKSPVSSMFPMMTVQSYINDELIHDTLYKLPRTDFEAADIYQSLVLDGLEFLKNDQLTRQYHRWIQKTYKAPWEL